MREWGKVSAILLAGGHGHRMASNIPKQYMDLGGKSVALHSFDLFTNVPEISEVVVVCHHDYRHQFPAVIAGVPVLFASPGDQRQDSVYSGLQQVSADSDFVCVHDAARPFVTRLMIQDGLRAAMEHGAATIAVPLKVTVKQSQSGDLVENTLDRSKLWEIQTPQVIRTPLLREAFQHALAHDLPVTDDVSLVEALGKPVKLVRGDYSNLKITTPEDLVIAECLLDRLLATTHG